MKNKITPKYNAYCHLSGEMPKHTLLKYANDIQKQVLEEAISELRIGKKYERAFEVVPLIPQIINTHKN